jgi:hypothetical protein
MPIVALSLATAACSSVKDAVTQDLPLEVQQQVNDEYKDRYVWTRVEIQDLGEGGVVPRDEKVKIVDVGMHGQGSVTVETLKKKNRVVQGLYIDKPLTKSKIDSVLAEYFWFDDPTLRQVRFIREFDKETARAIMNHDLFEGMSTEAARWSWGKPTRTEQTERNGVLQERWSYATLTPGKFKKIDFEDGKVKRWGE